MLKVAADGRRRGRGAPARGVRDRGGRLFRCTHDEGKRAFLHRFAAGRRGRALRHRQSITRSRASCRSTSRCAATTMNGSRHCRPRSTTNSRRKLYYGAFPLPRLPPGIRGQEGRRHRRDQGQKMLARAGGARRRISGRAQCRPPLRGQARPARLLPVARSRPTASIRASARPRAGAIGRCQTSRRRHPRESGDLRFAASASSQENRDFHLRGHDLEVLTPAPAPFRRRTPPASRFRPASSDDRQIPRADVRTKLRSCDTKMQLPHGHNSVLQRLLAVDVDMVGRLIQQIEVRLGQPQHQQAEAGLLSAGSVCRSGGACFSIDSPAAASSARRALSPTSKRPMMCASGVSRVRQMAMA